jgi:beta-lactamase class A
LELPRPDATIPEQPEPSALPQKPASRTRIRANSDAVPPSPADTRIRDNSDAVAPSPIDPADFLSNPKSAIARRNSNIRQLPRSIDRKSRNTKLGQVDLFDPRSNQETVSYPPTQLREQFREEFREELREQLREQFRETNLSPRESPTTPAPRPRNRFGSPSNGVRDTERPFDVKTQPVPRPRPQADKKPGKRNTEISVDAKTQPAPKPRLQTDKKLGNKPSKKPAPQSLPPLVYATRLLILGVGIAVISGTVLSVANAWNRSAVVAQEQSLAAAGENQTASAPATPATAEALQLNQEISAIKTQVQVLATENPNLTAGIFLVDLDTGSYLNFNGDVTFAAASTIKLPILIAFFQAVDEGKVQLDQMLTLQQEHIVGGSGDLQDQAPGTKYSALEVAKKMIVVSDNTATNMMIELLGGKEVLNQQFAAWGLRSTVIQNNLPDLEGTNTTSPKDLINALAQVDRGNLVSVKSRDRILQIMRQTENDSLLPKGLGEGAIIAHKTGNINSLLADSGMVDLPNGKRYLIAVMVKHSPETEKPAQTLIRDISRLSYRYLNGGETAADSQVKIKKDN